jgi:hypothetical protein
MKTKILLPLLVGALAACQNRAKQDGETAAEEISVAPLETTTCYQYQTENDLATLRLIFAGDVVNGELVYQLHEKDKNEGVVAGEFQGDFLLAEYTFMSEGVTSVRQVAFMRRGDDLVEGFGEMKEDMGKMVFVDPTALNFDDSGGIVLRKVSCPE